MSILTPQIATRTEDAPLSRQTAGVVHPTGVTGVRRAEVIVNADDWGLDAVTTNRTLDCFRAGVISSVSAMVFMADSERAAELARINSVDAGLHLNFTTGFSGNTNPHLLEHQQKIASKLTPHRFAAVFYHSGLAASFEYVVKAQMEEYERLFGATPSRFDGHHHMHLCANMLRQQLLPSGAIVRRNLSFLPGEKTFLNRLYRRHVDARLACRYRLADYFFDLRSVESEARLQRILNLCTRFDVEIEAHSIRDEEYRFLMNGGLKRCGQGVQVASGYLLRPGHRGRQENLA